MAQPDIARFYCWRFGDIGLTLLQVEYARLALLAAIELIPIFGPILSAIPPVIVALIQSPFLALKSAFYTSSSSNLKIHLIYP